MSGDREVHRQHRAIGVTGQFPGARGRLNEQRRPEFARPSRRSAAIQAHCRNGEFAGTHYQPSFGGRANPYGTLG